MWRVVEEGYVILDKDNKTPIDESNEELNLAYSVSMTTRKPRNNEEDGVHYFFRNRIQFEEAIENGELLEWAEFVGNYYGTPKQYVETKLNKEKID